MTTRRDALLLGGAAALGFAAPARAQGAWAPSRTVTVVVPYPAGGPTDVLARAVAQEIGAGLGQPVVVENVGGAAGVTGTLRVAQGNPDGHLLCFSTNQTHATNISLIPNGGGYHPLNDFAPIAKVVDLQHVLVVKNDLPVRTVAELVALAKREPGRLSCGSTGQGSASHLTLELFKLRAGTDIQHVAYRGSAPLLQDLLGGHVDLSFATVPTVLGQIRAGRLRAIAVASPNKSAHLPDLPTVAEAGVQGVEADAWLALFAPAAIPAPALQRYIALVTEAAGRESLRNAVNQQGMTVNLVTGDAFRRFLEADIQRWAEVVRVANVRAE
jgi:tripartite-type tricarboxylate transporter receptor subunit TctC